MLSYTNTSKQLVLATESQDLENLVSIFDTLHSITDLTHIYNRAIQERQLWLRNLTEFPGKPWVPALHGRAQTLAQEEQSYLKASCCPPDQDEKTTQRLHTLIDSEAQYTYWRYFPFFANLSFDGTPTKLKLAIPVPDVADADYCIANTETGRCYLVIVQDRVNPYTTQNRPIRFSDQRYLRQYDMERGAKFLSGYQTHGFLPNTRLVALHSHLPKKGQMIVRASNLQLNMSTDSFDSIVMKSERNVFSRVRRYAAARRTN